MECCSLDRFFPLLKRSGFAPTHIWDVGAHRGNWTRAAIDYFPDAEYTLIEPPDALKAVHDLIRGGYNLRWISAGAGNQAGTLPLYIAGATDLLGRTEFVLAEGSIGQLDFENMAGALIGTMDDYGYRLIDITDVLRSPNNDALWFCEFAFLLKSSGLLKHASRF